MPMFTELPCGVSLNNYLSALGHSRKSSLHLKRLWANGLSRLYHWLMKRPHSLQLWLFGVHSNRSMAASTVSISGVSLLDICNAAGWSSPHAFVRFYDLDLSTTGGRLLASYCSVRKDFTQNGHFSAWRMGFPIA